MTKEQSSKCHAIIHGAAAASGAVGAGFAQLPGSDSAVIVPIQAAMVISLAAVFGVTLTKAAATATVVGQTGTLVGRGLSQALVGWIPVLGNAINATTAAGITEALGWTVAKQFDRNPT